MSERRDRIKSIRGNAGSGAWNHRFIEEEIPEVLDQCEEGVSDAKIASEYIVAPSTVGAIRRGQTWKHVE